MESTISSRTPEGDPNRCPICGHHVRLEPSIDTRDAPCPSCGHLLWFTERTAYARDERVIVDLAKVIQETKEPTHDAQTALIVDLVKVVSKRLGPPPDAAKAAFDQVSRSKFARIEWDLVLLASTWAEVVGLIESTPD